MGVGVGGSWETLGTSGKERAWTSSCKQQGAIQGFVHYEPFLTSLTSPCLTGYTSILHLVTTGF